MAYFITSMNNNKQVLNKESFKQFIKEIVTEEIKKGNINKNFFENFSRYQK